MSTSDGCKDGASKSDGVCDVNNIMLHKMSTADEEDAVLSVCANCGKEGDDVNNICNKCMMVKYCNAACKKKHRHKHKENCEERVRRVAEKHNEVRIAAELHDEKLFKQPPAEDCPICFLRMPLISTGWGYQLCCGKVICCGCVHAPLYDDQGNEVAEKKCAFCRTPFANTIEEIIERRVKRMEKDDAIAIYNHGVNYDKGICGLQQDFTKALELWHRAAELGHTAAYSGIGNAYYFGRGVEVDKKKTKHYWELAAMGGNDNQGTI